jgi:multidrug efflux pump subunit AcrA (membrane-fusion protein)
MPGGIKAATAAAGSRPAPAPSNQGTVYVLRDAKPVRVPVVVGLDDDTHAEIIKGDLQPGEKVITTEQRNGTASRQVTGPRLRF